VKKRAVRITRSLGRWFAVDLLAATMLFALGTLTIADAEVAIKGSIGAVQIEARDCSLMEILNALRDSFHLQYRASVSLNRSVTGTFKGPMLEVLSHLLKGYDFVVRRSDVNRFEVFVVNFAGKDSDKDISTLVNSPPNSLWRARSYSRRFPRIPPSRRNSSLFAR
jgi:hypothetical protein